MIEAVSLSLLKFSLSSVGTDRELPTVCFTGKMPEKRSYYEELAKSKGFLAVDTVSKELSLLVASDVEGNSSKLTKARKNGVKIVSLEDFLQMDAVENAVTRSDDSAEKKDFSSAVEQQLLPQKVVENTSETPRDKPEQLLLGI